MNLLFARVCGFGFKTEIFKKQKSKKIFFKKLKVKFFIFKTYI